MGFALRWIGYSTAGVLAVASLGLAWPALRGMVGTNKPGCTRVSPVQAPASDEVQGKDALAGLWRRPASQPGQVRFYYFHGNSKGLYRYGQSEWNQTNSFDYLVRDRRVILKFRKDGKSHESSFQIEAAQGKRTLRLDKDPKERGARYEWSAPPMGSRIADQALQKKGLGGYMWMHNRSFARGGSEFAMYQFNAPAVDGRGVGWFHRGDFDDWTTESFRYRIEGEKIAFFFEYQQRHEASSFELVEGSKRHRVLHLGQDPRNFWLQRGYQEMGPSFGGHPAFMNWTHFAAWPTSTPDQSR